jgi:hypothetical protein
MKVAACVVGVMLALWFGFQAGSDLALTGFPDSHFTDYDTAVELPKRVLMWIEFGFVPLFLLLALPRFGARAPFLALAALAVVVVVQLVGVPWYFGTHLGLDNGIGG